MRKGKEKTKKWSKEEWEVRSSSDPLTFFRGRPRKEVKMKQEKVKEEIKKETKGPMKKVDEVRPGAICKNCQGHMNHNRAGQVCQTTSPLGKHSKKKYGIIWEFFPTWGGGSSQFPKPETKKKCP